MLSARRDRITVEPVLMQMLVSGLIAARLVFVWIYREDYFQDPLRIIDIRDGGFSVSAGLAAAAIVAGVRAWRHILILRHLVVALAAGGAVWVGGTGALNYFSPPAPALENLALINAEGQTQSLDALQGKPVVVNLWATWCPPCRREMPILAEAQVRETRVEFIFVSQGEEGAAVSEYLAREGLSLRNVFVDSHGEWAMRFGAAGMPTTLFFDAKGELKSAHTGELSRASLKRGLADIQQ